MTSLSTSYVEIYDEHSKARIVMYSEYERQKDKRDYGSRRELYKGPVYGFPAERIIPARIVKWNEEGLPTYEEMGGEAQE